MEDEVEKDQNVPGKEDVMASSTEDYIPEELIAYTKSSYGAYSGAVWMGSELKPQLRLILPPQKCISLGTRLNLFKTLTNQLFCMMVLGLMVVPIAQLHFRPLSLRH